MKIFSKAQIYEADKVTVQRQHITSTELMERAATSVYNWVDSRFKEIKPLIHIFCGIGNNGGDGLVLARHLFSNEYKVNVYIVNYSEKHAKDFLINYDRLKEVSNTMPKEINSKKDFPQIDEKDVIVDAIFGVGLNRVADDWVKELFQYFKASKAFTISIDIPSGLYLDRIPEDMEGVVWADYALTFQFPKLVLCLPDTGKYSKEWCVLDIGIDKNFIDATETEAEFIEKPNVSSIYKSRDKFSHKGNFGHALIIGGSYGKIGAVTLSSRAGLSSGAGLVTAYVPQCGYQILQTTVPEAMVITDKGMNYISSIKFDLAPSVIGIGIGLGTDPKTIHAFKEFLKSNKVPLVIDADGINILSKDKSLLKSLPEKTVLTPHSKELERLVGPWKDDFEKLQKVKEFSNQYGVIVVIKGAYTLTVFENRMYVNSTGNPGLATAGSGDVLTGIITGLIAQRYKPLEAAVFGVYLHGRAADIAKESMGEESLIASEIIKNLGLAYLDILEQ